jgi:hypothetical protein
LARFWNVGSYPEALFTHGRKCFEMLRHPKMECDKFFGSNGWLKNCPAARLQLWSASYARFRVTFLLAHHNSLQVIASQSGIKSFGRSATFC